MSVFDAESSTCHDFNPISEEERLAGPVNAEVHVNAFGAGPGQGGA